MTDTSRAKPRLPTRFPTGASEGRHFDAISIRSQRFKSVVNVRRNTVADPKNADTLFFFFCPFIVTCNDAERL